MTTQVLRIECRAKLTGALLAHSAGLSRPAIARQDMTGRSNVTAKHEPDRAAKLIEQARKARGERRPGRPPSEGISMLFGGPPPYGDAGEWADEKVRDWAAETTKWAMQKMSLPLVAAALHRDESSPHLHLEFAAVKGGKFVPWRNLRERITGENHHRRAMTKLQDMYHADVAGGFDLDRGERKSGHKRKHKKISQTKSVAALTRERDRLTERNAQLEEEAEQAEEQAQNKASAIVQLARDKAALIMEEARGELRKSRRILRAILNWRERMAGWIERAQARGAPKPPEPAEELSPEVRRAQLIALASKPLRKSSTTAEERDAIRKARAECKSLGVRYGRRSGRGR